jgi:hypothetical protein
MACPRLTTRLQRTVMDKCQGTSVSAPPLDRNVRPTALADWQTENEPWELPRTSG